MEPVRRRVDVARPVALMESPTTVKPGTKMQDVQVPCPHCLNANREARRRCKRTGGMCKGTGYVTKSVPVERSKLIVP